MPSQRHDPECNPAMTEKRLGDLEDDNRDLKDVVSEIKVTLGRLDERLGSLIWFNRGIGGSLGAGLALLVQWLRSKQ